MPPKCAIVVANVVHGRATCGVCSAGRPDRVPTSRDVSRRDGWDREGIGAVLAPRFAAAATSRARRAGGLSQRLGLRTEWPLRARELRMRSRVARRALRRAGAHPGRARAGLQTDHRRRGYRFVGRPRSPRERRPISPVRHYDLSRLQHRSMVCRRVAMKPGRVAAVATTWQRENGSRRRRGYEVAKPCVGTRIPSSHTRSPIQPSDHIRTPRLCAASFRTDPWPPYTTIRSR